MKEIQQHTKRKPPHTNSSKGFLLLGKNKTYLSEHLSAGFMQLGPGPGCIKPPLKCPLKYVTYESVMGTLTGVAWNHLALS